MNKQPFYHVMKVLFTATRELTMAEVEDRLKRHMNIKGLLMETITVEELDAEPGDPADLM